MTNNIQKYTTYKPSGVEWLGDIPEHWEATKVKNIFRLNIEPAPKNNEEELLSVYTEIGVKPRRELEEKGNKASTTDGYWRVKKGDIIVNKLLAWMGAIGVSEYNGVTSPAYDVLRAKVSLNSQFYHYLFRNEACVSELKKHSRGIMDMRLRLYFDKFGDIIIPFPKLSEQNLIVNFLDTKTALIDKAIGIKEKQIELLKERRQIMIHRAVTRGIDPNVKLKPSGVEWIGDIPEHWVVKALKHIAKLQSGETISAEQFVEEGYPVFGGNGFRGYSSSFTNDGKYALIGRQGALCGNVNYAEGKFYASEHAIVVYPIRNENFLWLGETIKIADFNRLSQSAAQPGIAVSVIKNVLFPYPPIEEQEKLAKYILDLSSKIATAISLKEQEIEKLKEYKSVLINSAVTGKIKVG